MQMFDRREASLGVSAEERLDTGALLQDLTPTLLTPTLIDSFADIFADFLFVGFVFAAVALPGDSRAQTSFSCTTDPLGSVCLFSPSIQYVVGGDYQGATVNVYGTSRDEACLGWAVATPNPYRRTYVGVRPFWNGSNYYYCQFLYDFGPPYTVVQQDDGANREIKVCPVNSQMFNVSGQYDANNWTRPGALFLDPPYAERSMPYSTTLYPSSVFAEGNVRCASRGAPDPTRNFGETCPGPRTGNPINLGVEIKTQREADFAHVGGLRFVRTYNSGAGTTYYTGVLGKGWQHNLASRVSASASVASVWRGDGKIVPFELSGTTWASWADVNDRLAELKDALGVRTGWRYFSAASGDTEVFDVSGSLVSMSTSRGAVVLLVYSNGTASGPNGGVVEGTSTALPRSLLLRATDQFGAVLSFGYNADSRIVRLTRPDGNEIRYAYSAAGNLVSATYPDTNAAGQSVTRTRTYLYENVGFPSALTGITDETGQRLSTYTYDSFGRAITTEWAGGVNRHGLTLNADGTTTVTDALGAQRTYNFTTINGRVLMTDQSQPGGAGCGPSSSAITYDANANVTSRTDFNNTKTCYGYDLTRNLETKRVEGLPGSVACTTALSSPPPGDSVRTVSTQWHPDWRLETRRSEPKLLTTWTYNGQGATCAPTDALVDGKPIAVICSRTEQPTTDESGAQGFAAVATGTARTWTFTYNRFGQILTSNGPRGDVTDTATYEYYPDTQADWTLGDLKQITNPLGHTTRFTRYNRHGQALQRIDPNGLVTNYTYDLRQRLTSVTVGSEATVYEYFPTGLLKKATLPDGSFIAYTYDPAQRLTQIDDHKGSRIVYTLDAMGNRINEQATDPGGQLKRSASRVIDALNRVQQMTGAMQ
jgi:YD repeat-containing protein